MGPDDLERLAALRAKVLANPNDPLVRSVWLDALLERTPKDELRLLVSAELLRRIAHVRAPVAVFRVDPH